MAQLVLQYSALNHCATREGILFYLFIYFCTFYPFLVISNWLQSCLIAATPVLTREANVESRASPETQPKPHCFLTQCPLYPEASRTNVSEETPCTWQPWLAYIAPGPPQESLVRDETRISLPAKPSLTRTTDRKSTRLNSSHQ